MDVQAKRKREMNERNADHYHRRSRKQRKIEKRKRAQARQLAWLEAMGITTPDAR